MGVHSWLMIGCRAEQRVAPVNPVLDGQYALAVQRVHQSMTSDLKDRQYLLDRVKLAVLMLADGRPEQAQPLFESIYEILRTQGINEDKTVASVVTYEGVKFWKGEPFEQALALLYYGLQQAQLNQWDNARAAAGNALFRLRDFGDNDYGQRINTLEIAQRALEYEQAKAQGRDPGKPGAQDDDYLDHGYAVRDSNFALGYLLHGIASLRMDRVEEANDYLRVAAQVNPNLRDLVAGLRSRNYNTILVVSYGLGPRKVAYGPDNALARFEPRGPSDTRPLLVNTTPFPVACDLNMMAIDHMWNNLEDVRRAKSTIGNVLLYGGLIATSVGSSARSDEAVYAGLGAMLAGALAKAGAHADTRYCDLLPQRYYVALADTSAGVPVQLMIDGLPGTRLVLTGLSAQPEGGVQLRYIRLVTRGSPAPPAWAVSGEIQYDNDITPDAVGSPLPYILGGRSVRLPGNAALSAYQQAGYLLGFTTADLRRLYRDEGLALEIQDRGGRFGRHVLEGGRSMIAPLGGTVGFVRLFGQNHPPYQPRAQSVRHHYLPPRSDVAMNKGAQP